MRERQLIREIVAVVAVCVLFGVLVLVSPAHGIQIACIQIDHFLRL